MEVGLRHRDLVVTHTVDLVCHTYRDLLETREHIELGEEEVSETVNARCEARNRRVEPTTATRTPCGRTTLTTDRAKPFAICVEQLRRERPRTHASCVGLENADDTGDASRSDAAAGACAARGWVG